MTSGAVERNDARIQHKAVTTERAGRNWGAIGLGLAAAFSVIALYAVCIWCVVVLAEALV